MNRMNRGGMLVAFAAVAFAMYLLRAALGGGCLMSGHAVLPHGNLASLLLGAERHVLLDAAAVGDDPPEAAKAVWAFDDLRDGHDSLRAAHGG